jgi:sigma-B regulation protein RsbU (phosphoserine phosphatase)
MPVFSVSIRTRILALIVSALGISLSVYLYLGQNLIVQDKTSYIFDASFSKVTVTSELVRSAVDRFLALVPTVRRSGIDALELNEKQAFFALLRVNSEGILQVDAAKGESKGELLKLVSWNPSELLAGKIRIRIDSDGKSIEVVAPLKDRTFLFGRVFPSRALLEGASRDFQIRILPHHEAQAVFPPEIWASLNSGEFISGVKEVNLQGSPYLIAYEKLLGGEYWVLTFVSKDAAFSAARELTRKSIALGASLFFFTLAGALVLIRSLITRIQALVDATTRVSEGDFSHELKTGLKDRDEVGTLSRAFDLMRRKISELLITTAEKARMEKELETAHLVQNRFFPDKDVKQKSIQITGQSLMASECGGDFWHYRVFREQILLIMGDVTGHGVSAALITAAVFAVFCQFVDQLKKEPHRFSDATEILRALCETLNKTLLAAGGGDSTFPCLVALIDLDQNHCTILNAGHPPPFLFRSSAQGAQFEMLKTASNLPLGQPGDYAAEASNHRLEPGEKIFWYTDGLFDARTSDQTKMKKKDLFQKLCANASGDLAHAAIEEARLFFGSDATHRPDDITAIMISRRA